MSILAEANVQTRLRDSCGYLAASIHGNARSVSVQKNESIPECIPEAIMSSTQSKKNNKKTQQHNQLKY